jgi:hypothetical protein
LKKVSEIALFDLFYRPAGVSLDFHSPLQNTEIVVKYQRVRVAKMLFHFGWRVKT